MISTTQSSIDVIRWLAIIFILTDIYQFSFLLEYVLALYSTKSTPNFSTAMFTEDFFVFGFIFEYLFQLFQLPENKLLEQSKHLSEW